ncbi:hypothetical protein G7Y89_g4462 [Cudoniella acicularis]|uniref:Glycoside hydrolase family 2 protein n=1 Tax=Cudoniella acicularis TaxID=354080 RepID=A0A8H4RQ79_9HELO|nr:hypothetical protein G7Y89_g4462 [Cudoniella acicularis]
MEYVSVAVNAALQKRDNMADYLSPKKANPLSYPKSSQPFSIELFKHPTAEYRGCPFWAWNCKLDKAQLFRQIDYFAEMGMGGFHMHVRVGLDTKYMGEEFMGLIRSCVDYAESKKMLACLYDEDRWPSGSAGGLVISKWPETKSKHVVFTPRSHGTVNRVGEPESDNDPVRTKDSRLLATYDITLDENGCLKSSRLLKEGQSGANEWYLYEETNGPDPWFNDQTYVDTLSEDAIAKFISITHETYKAKVGDKFGTTIPCIFTDEPQFTIKRQLGNPKSADDVVMPWTTDLPQSFKKTIFFRPYRKIPRTRVESARGKSQHSSTAALGEAMRCYRSMDMPGMDLLCDWTEYNTAKQVTSVARQNGLRGAMSELYGVTHWDFTFEGHKGCGDWQAVLGITFRVHHLTWVSMAGEGKRDYPACIGYQSPWYKEYGYIEDHFARVGVAMTRGKAVTRIAVIHPIESYWLAFGPNGSGDELDVRDKAFGDLSWWLLHGHIDFDFISESLLPGQISGKATGKKLQVGACEYDVVILPNLRTIRSTTLKVLREFAKTGGHVVVAGSGPDLVDAQVPKSTPSIEGSRSILWGQQSIVTAMDQYRDVRILNEQGNAADRYLYQMRQDGEDRFVFIVNRDRNAAENTTLKLKGKWAVEEFNTLTGKDSIIFSHIEDCWTVFPYRFEGCTSLLVRLTPFKTSMAILAAPAPLPLLSDGTSDDVVLDSIELAEQNVLLLDLAQYKLDDENWSQPTEVLRIDNEIRARIGMPRKGGGWRQPWTVPFSDRASRTYVTMRFIFNSSFNIRDRTSLALEDADTMKIYLNGLSLTTKKADVRPYWVDEAITTLEIPGDTIKTGSNVLTVSFPFGILTNIERIYILGAFAVHVDGRTASLEPLRPGLLFWGNIVDQGFPFYVGNITYNCSFYTSSSKVAKISVPNFSSPLLSVSDTETGKKIGNIAFQPRTLELGKLAKGSHKISITAYGNRFNSFGHIHMPGWITACFPDVWRSGGDWWTDNYDLKPVGILSCPQISTFSSPSLEDEPEHPRKDSGEWVLVHRGGTQTPSSVSISISDSEN